MRKPRPNPRREVLGEQGKMGTSAVMPASGEVTRVHVTHQPHTREAAVPPGKPAPPKWSPTRPWLTTFVILLSHWILCPSVYPWSCLTPVPIDFPEHVSKLGHLRRTLASPHSLAVRNPDCLNWSLALPWVSRRPLHKMLHLSKSCFPYPRNRDKDKNTNLVRYCGNEMEGSRTTKCAFKQQRTNCLKQKAVGLRGPGPQLSCHPEPQLAPADTGPELTARMAWFWEGKPRTPRASLLQPVTCSNDGSFSG